MFSEGQIIDPTSTTESKLWDRRTSQDLPESSLTRRCSDNSEANWRLGAASMGTGQRLDGTVTPLAKCH